MAAPAKLRIATFNVENLDFPIEPRLAVLRPALERLEADVLCLQEVNAQHVRGERDRVLAALDALIEGTRYQGYARAATHLVDRAGPADVHNLVTLSRLPILASRQVLHEIVPAPQTKLVTAVPPSAETTAVRFDRPFLVTELDLGAQRLHVINVHLRAPIASAIPGQKARSVNWLSVAGWAEGYFLSDLKRAGQALELRLLVERVFDADREALVAVAGDFNAEANEAPMRLLAAVSEDTGNAALAERSLVLLDRALEASRRFSVVHHGRPQMLDHILASHRLYGHFRSIAVNNEALGDEAVGYGKHVQAAGSYHAAVVAEFAL